MTDAPRPPRAPGLVTRLSAALRRAGEAAAERPEVADEAPRGALAAQSRRDFLLLGAGALATAATGWWLLPDGTKQAWQPALHDPLDTLAARVGLTAAQREASLNRVLSFDDDVAEALYSTNRQVRTYARADPRPLRNNYHGRTPGPEILPGWRLNLTGLASGRAERLTLGELGSRFARHDMNTRLVCVEGWSHVAAWGGIRFADLLAAFPPASGARWAALRSAVSLGASGAPEPYYVSIDLGTARHPQSLLATHHAGAPLTLAHGAPLRLVVPMKLGLKNIKAVTDIAYTADEPADYWNERGYSKYDGI
jgi:DMSO/TMAO reductase YedYZ molybdopterin-dependent catalytic subunit